MRRTVCREPSLPEKNHADFVGNIYWSLRCIPIKTSALRNSICSAQSSGLAIPCNVVMLANDPDSLVVWIGDGWNKDIPGLKRNR
jgi:hypothetical protein